MCAGLLGGLLPNAPGPFPGLPATPPPLSVPLPTQPGGGGLPIPGGPSVPDTGAALPTTKSGAPWDFSASGDLRTAAGTIWSQLSGNSK